MALSSELKLIYLRELCKEIAKQHNYQQDHNTDSIMFNAEGIFAYCTPGWRQMFTNDDWPADNNIKIEVMREIDTIPQETEWLDYRLCFKMETDLCRYNITLYEWKMKELCKDQETPYEIDLNKAVSSKQLWELGVERGQRMNTCVAPNPKKASWSVKRTYTFWHNIMAENREEALLLSEELEIDNDFLILEECYGDNYYAEKN